MKAILRRKLLNRTSPGPRRQKARSGPASTSPGALCERGDHSDPPPSGGSPLGKLWNRSWRLLGPGHCSTQPSLRHSSSSPHVKPQADCPIFSEKQ